MIITVIVLIVSSILFWPLLQAALFMAIVKKINKKDFGKTWKVVKKYLKERAERKIFLTYLTTMGGVAGLFPSGLIAGLKVISGDTCVLMAAQIQNNYDWVSAVMGICITLGYGFYSYNKKHHSREELLAMFDLIDNEFNFRPNQEWFAKQNIKAINSLGKRYSELQNFPYKDMPWALASVARDDSFRDLLSESFGSFICKYRTFSEGNNNYKISKDKAEKIKKLVEEIVDLYKNSVGLQNLIHIRNKVDFLHSFTRDLYYDEVGNWHDNYSLKDFKYAIYKLSDDLHNQWIELQQKQTLLVVGSAGMGKSHFLGDLVTLRKKKGLPSILLLGQHYTDTEDPLSQICKKIDVRCKKERFLSELNEYGKHQNQRVLIIIDALNEGAGSTFWSKHIDDFVFDIEKYKYLGLIMSFRITERKNWYYDMAHSNKYSVYHHRGFAGNQQAACEYLFRSFYLEQPAWPVYSEEFTNPLFLINYCRSHQQSGRPLVMEDFWKTINSYCESVNQVLADKYNYNSAQNLVFYALCKVASLMVETDNRWRLTYMDAIASLTDIAKYTKNSIDFLDYLIDEGMLTSESSQEVTTIDFGFERFGDYFIAFYLLQNKESDLWFNDDYGNNIEALTILAPVLKNKELVEFAPQDKIDFAASEFFYTLGWRDSLTKKGQNMLQNIKDGDFGDALLIVLSKCLYKKDWIINADCLYEKLWNLSMSERDAIWTIKISDRYSEIAHDFLSLAEWGTNISPAANKGIDNETLRLCCETLLWVTSSTRRELRDKATNALANLLTERQIVLDDLLKKYSDINDPYIEERLWAAAYGATLCAQSKAFAKNTASTTYSVVFNQDKISENILVRDFAKGIIDYALSLGAELDIDIKKTKPPYGDGELPEIPNGEEIDLRYKLDYDTVENKDVYFAQSSILSSMATEHSSREHMYGDFGRYVFQSKLRDFPEDAEELSWCAIEMIFSEYGYNAEVFAKFDSQYSNRDRSLNHIERIGKKYQYIAMHRIMSILMDRHFDIDFSDSWSTPTQNARSIDTTITSVGKHTDERYCKYQIPDYDASKIADDLKWLRSISDMPDIKEYLESIDDERQKWINLFAYNKTVWQPISIDKEPAYIRDLFVFVQSFLVDIKYKSEVCKMLHKYGIEGRSFHENREIYYMYSREFYWSENYKQLIESKGYSKIPFSVGHIEKEDILIEPTYLQYQLEHNDDASKEEGFNMLLPNQCLYEGLELMYAKENGAWVDSNGTVLCLDNNVYGKGRSALMVRKDALMKYLHESGKCIIWPILIERMIRTDLGYNAHHVQCGGYVYLDEKGSFHHKFRDYEPSMFQKWKVKQKPKWEKLHKKFLLFLVKHHLIKLPLDKRLNLYSEDEALSFLDQLRQQEYKNEND